MSLHELCYVCFGLGSNPKSVDIRGNKTKVYFIEGNEPNLLCLSINSLVYLN